MFNYSKQEHFSLENYINAALTHDWFLSTIFFQKIALCLAFFVASIHANPDPKAEPEADADAYYGYHGHGGYYR